MTKSTESLKELFEACRAKLNEVDTKKVATPIAEAAGKTVVLSVTAGLALSAVWLNALINASKEVGEMKEESPGSAAPTNKASSSSTQDSAASPSPEADAVDQLVAAAVQSIHLTTVYTLELTRVWARNSQTLLSSLLNLLRAR